MTPACASSAWQMQQGLNLVSSRNCCLNPYSLRTCLSSELSRAQDSGWDALGLGGTQETPRRHQQAETLGSLCPMEAQHHILGLPQAPGSAAEPPAPRSTAAFVLLWLGACPASGSEQCLAPGACSSAPGALVGRLWGQAGAGGCQGKGGLQLFVPLQQILAWG